MFHDCAKSPFRLHAPWWHQSAGQVRHSDDNVLLITKCEQYEIHSANVLLLRQFVTLKPGLKEDLSKTPCIRNQIRIPGLAVQNSPLKEHRPEILYIISISDCCFDLLHRVQEDPRHREVRLILLYDLLLLLKGQSENFFKAGFGRPNV